MERLKKEKNWNATIMYSSDRDLLEHCGTDCASYEDDKRLLN